MSFQEIGGADLNVQDVLPGTGITTDGDDVIRVWNPGSGTYTTGLYWDETYDTEDNEMGPGWGNGRQDRLDITLFAGQGFWVQTIGNVVISFPVPAAL